MKELYKTMRQDDLLTTTNTTSITPPPQLTGNKATRGILGICTLLILSLVMGACGSSDDTDDTKPTTGKSDKTPTTDKDKTVTVTFDGNYEEATDTPPVAQTIKKGDKATAPTDPTRDGYTFDNWYTDTATKNVFAFTTPITGDMTLYAGWIIKTYTVTFDGNYDGAAAATTATVEQGETTIAPTPPERTGYTFDNWYTQQDGSGTAFAFTTVITGDMTLYAGWIIKTYTVTFDFNYTGAAAATTATVEHGKTTTKPADPTRDDYTFGGWYDAETGGNKFAFNTTPITKNTKLYAKWIDCPAREARKELTHVVPLYNGGTKDAPYVPEKLLGSFRSGSGETIYGLSPNIPTAPAGQEDELPYISPLSHVASFETINTLTFRTGGFEITPDYIDASFTHPTTAEDPTVRISCYSMKQVNDSLYFYYGKVTFLFGQETTAFNKSMYAWTGINKNDPANKDALYGYMVSIQGDYLRALKIYPFVGGTYTRASDGKTVTFPKTEEQYAALTLEDLQIIATAPLTSDKLFARYPEPVYSGIFGIPNN